MKSNQMVHCIDLYFGRLYRFLKSVKQAAFLKGQSCLVVDRSPWFDF